MMNVLPDPACCFYPDPAAEVGRLGAFHNSGAPPRAKITLKPLRTHGKTIFSIHRGNIGDLSPGGLAWVVRIDLDKLIQEHFAGFAWLATAPRKIPHLRLKCCVAIARTIGGKTSWIGTEELKVLGLSTFEQLYDELRGILAAIDPAPLDLPPLGMMIRADLQDRPFEPGAARAFYTLSRINGSTFVKGGSAMINGNLDGNIQLDLWVPA